MSRPGLDPRGGRLTACFVLPGLGASGGVAVLLGHARRLAAHGVDATIALTAPADAASVPPGVRVRTLAEARGERWDLAVASWWETAPAMFELEAARHVAFLQSLEERFYGERDLLERLGAASVLGLPVHFVAVAGWLRAVVGELRPDARCPIVRPGIDKDAFRPRPSEAPRSGGPLRVLVEGQPEVWFKAIPEAIAVARAMREPARVTLVAPHPESAGGLGADRVAGGLDAAGMSALYAEHDVVLKLSRVEGFGLAPLEAMHVGLPCVVTPYTGHEEYVRHGENGLVVGFDDEPGATAALDALAADRSLLERLGRGARATAAAWPSGVESTATLAAALRELADAPAPDPGAAARCALRRQRLAIELGRAQLGELRLQERLAAEVPRLEGELEERRRQVVGMGEQLEAIRAERAYRAAVRVRDLLGKVRP
jgi:glycosyltransferase involved in cell wall biosynthesis